jgi:hypothetical protein
MTEGQSETYNLLREAENSGALDFALESSKAVVQTTGAGSSPRPEGPPEQRIEEFRTIYDTDPLVGQAVDKMVEYLVGSGFNIEPRNVPFTDTEQTAEDIADLKRLVELSDFNGKLIEWVKRAVVDGTAFLELVWNSETDEFEPNLLPTLDMEIQPDEYGNDGKYILDTSGQDGEVEYESHEVAVLRFYRQPKEMWGHSFIERAQEQTDMLRDMEIDMARFISTKAYPPILWKLGDADNNIHWTDDQIEGWLDTVENIEPDSMLAAGDDVDYDVVGSTSTSSESGVMNLDGTFTHLQTRVATAFGIPAFLLNLDAGTGRNDSVTQMPSFDRRIQALRVPIQNAVEQQIFRSIMGHPDPENFTDMVPRFEFGEHSSEEERLETDEALKLFNNGFLTREAFAQRVGIDPEVEMPTQEELTSEIIPVIQQLAGSGDDIQNPEGGAPTDTGGGADSSGGEVKSRQNPENDTSDDDSRNQQSVDNE